MPLIFVYGTLKRGDVRSENLRSQRFIAAARTRPEYRMVDCGDYPGLVEVETDGREIEGELYDVTPECLLELDDVEGVDEGLYARRMIRLQPPFDATLAEAYFYLPSIAGMPDCGTQWLRRGSSNTE
jgi:gamma-glutamylcyclotransferase (GGCT)/AIG2-like uncharacterized protein YtfP